MDKKLAHLILDEIVDQGPVVKFSDIGQLCYTVFSEQNNSAASSKLNVKFAMVILSACVWLLYSDFSEDEWDGKFHKNGVVDDILKYLCELWNII